VREHPPAMTVNSTERARRNISLSATRSTAKSCVTRRRSRRTRRVCFRVDSSRRCNIELPGACGSVDGIPTARSVDHVGFTVPNLDEAVSFFTRVLDCDLLYRTRPYFDPAGESDARARAVDGWRRRIPEGKLPAAPTAQPGPVAPPAGSNGPIRQGRPGGG